MRSRKTLQWASLTAILGVSLCFASSVPGSPGDLEKVVNGLQQRYASTRTLQGSFKQTYRAPGIEQVESGVFRMKRPGLMRWEYRQPEKKLFVADGRESFLYVPADRQVTIQPFQIADLRGTPLEILIGGADIRKTFEVSWENDSKWTEGGSILIRLTPRRSQGQYDYLVLALDAGSYEIQRLVIHESGGNTSEFVLTDMVANAKIDDGEFRFKPPKGTEIIRMENPR